LDEASRYFSGFINGIGESYLQRPKSVKYPMHFVKRRAGKKTGLAVVVPVTNAIKGYPFEVNLPPA